MRLDVARPKTDAMLLLTVVAIAMSFVWGVFVDRLGPKRTLVLVLTSWAVGLLIGGFAIGVGPSGFVLFLLAGAILGSGLRTDEALFRWGDQWDFRTRSSYAGSVRNST